MKILINRNGTFKTWDQNDLTSLTCAICNKNIPYSNLFVNLEDILPHIKCAQFLVEGSKIWN